jgi:hypothetical protein
VKEPEQQKKKKTKKNKQNKTETQPVELENKQHYARQSNSMLFAH